MNTSNIKAERFLSGEDNIDFEINECFEMKHEIPKWNGSGYGTLAGAETPEFIIVPVLDALRELAIHTQSLRILEAPKELCLKKCMELLEEPARLEMNLSAFRLDLTVTTAGDVRSFEDVDSLINGIRCCALFLHEFFTEAGLYIRGRLSYTYDRYEDGLLILSKFMYYHGNDKLPKTPAVIPRATFILQ